MTEDSDRCYLPGHDSHDYNMPNFEHFTTLYADFDDGEWTLVMHRAGVRHMAKFRSKLYTYLGQVWKNIFMFSKEGPYPGVSDITIHNFDMIQEGRIVVFYGKYFIRSLVT